jgi:hypothetical protein
MQILFLVVVASSLRVVATRVEWEGRLRVANFTWITHLPLGPLWNPPEAPTYELFRDSFDDLPPAGAPGLSIERILKWDWTLADLLLYLWVVNGLFGLLYLMLRRGRRDLVLHCGLGTALGLTGGAMACIGLWLVFGGWGPPCPEFFGLTGAIIGLLGSRLSWHRNAGTG